MRRNELIIEILRQIEKAAKKIIDRFEVINQVSDFTDSQAGIWKLLAADIPIFDKIPVLIK